MTLDRRLSKLEASILPEVRPPKVVVIEGYRDGEDMDAARDRHFAAHPEDRGATLVVFIRKMLAACRTEGSILVSTADGVADHGDRGNHSGCR